MQVGVQREREVEPAVDEERRVGGPAEALEGDRFFEELTIGRARVAVLNGDAGAGLERGFDAKEQIVQRPVGDDDE